MSGTSLRAFIHALPKVELHVHLVGSASVDTVLALACRRPEAGVPAERADLARFFAFRDFDHFLKVYWAVQSMLRDRDDIRTLVVGHATSCTADPSLLAYLAEHRVPLEVCPTSNVRTRQVDSVAAHPVRRMLDHGLVVTLNTDDPPLFGTTLEGEYLAVAETLGLNTAEVAQLATNAVTASFLDAATKTALCREISSS